MKKVLILIAEGLEECEALVPNDLLLRAGIECDLVSISNNLVVKSSHNLNFSTNKLIKDINPDEYSLLMLPGGMPGTTNLENSKEVQSLIDLFIKEDKYIAAICAAPSILIKKGLLKSEEFVCYPGFECGLTQRKEKVHVHKKIITAKGLGAAFEFSKEIITHLLDSSSAIDILNKIQL